MATYVSKVVSAEAVDGSGRNALFPVRYGPLKKRPFPHGVEQEEDLTNWAGNPDDATFERLAARLETLCGVRTRPAGGELAAWLAAEEANNAEAFRDFARKFPKSRYAKDAEPRAAESEMRVADMALAREAAVGIVEKFANEVRKPSSTPPLRLQRFTKEVVPFSREELLESLQKGGSAVLQAEPGGGKTTALLDLAFAYSSASDESIGVYVRLKELASQGDELFAHLAKLESARLISEAAWFELAQSGSLAIFCDGWNELSNLERDRIGPILDRYVRSYPSAGLVVGTRPLAPPPLRGEHLLLALQRLTREQIREIVQDRMGPRAASALAELRHSRDLVELVRNPFFLVAFCVTREAGSQPSTRESLIAGMLHAMAAKPEHAGPLREVLGDRQEKYLKALAVEMMHAEGPELGSDQARMVVNSVSADLKARRIEDDPPKADLVLGTLRDHHCLIERGSGSELAYEFQHQLINEWYAAEEVRAVAKRALLHENDRRALEQILNRRVWTEALLFAAERPTGQDGVDATAHMTLLAIGIDPDFAGEIIAAASDEVWKKAAPAVKEVVWGWLETSKARVIRFVLRCGKSDFADILWAAIREEKDHNAAQALHSTRIAHPQVLGPNWRALTAGLEERGRKAVLGMLASNSGWEGAKMALEGALADAAPAVQSDVADMLSFYRFDEQLVELLAGLKDEAWEVLVRRDHIPELWNKPWRERAASAAHRVLEKMETGPARIAFALRMKERGQIVDIDLVADLLAVRFEQGAREQDLFEKVAEAEPERLSSSLIEKALQGERVPYFSARFILNTATVDQDRLITACRTSQGNAEVLAPLLDVSGARALFLEFLEAQARYKAATPRVQNSTDLVRKRLSDILYNADKSVLARVILSHEPANAREIGELAYIIMRAYRRDFGHDERPSIDPDLRDRLVTLLRDWAERLMSDETAPRYLLHEVAEAMATFPDAKLLAPLRGLIEADISRRRREKVDWKAARERGETPRDSSARMGYEYRYGQNMLSLAKGRNSDIAHPEEEEVEPPKELSDAVTDVMAEFLLDAEFGGEAARVIANLRPDPISSVGKRSSPGYFNLSLVQERRAARKESGLHATDPLAARILDAVVTLMADGSGSSQLHAVRLACTAARMECGDRFGEVTRCVLQHGSVPEITDYLNMCLHLGHPVNGEAARKCLDALDARRQERKWEYWEQWFQWEGLLVLMIFGGLPIEAVERLLTYDTKSRDYRLDRILEALGVCQHPDALSALQRLSDRLATERWSPDWARAVARIGTSDAGHALLSFLLEGSTRRNWYAERDLSTAVAQIAENDASLRSRILEIARDGDEQQMKVVSSIVSHISKEHFLREIIALPGVRLNRLVGAISDTLRGLSVEDRPGSGADHLRPRPIPELRAQLFRRAMDDEEAASTCLKLLQRIDEWREWYGDPVNESRHPDISLEKPWPSIAQPAWNAAAKIRSHYASRNSAGENQSRA